MIVLSTSDTLRITLGSALNVDYSVHYIDTATDTPGINKGTYATASTTAIVSAPSTGSRIVKTFFICNRDISPVTVTLDIYNGSTAYRVRRLSIGLDETLAYTNDGLAVLTSNGSVPSFRAYRSAAQTGIATAPTVTKIQFETETFDTHGYYDTTNHRFLPLIAGKYWVSGQVWLTGLADQKVVNFLFYKNGVDTQQGPGPRASGAVNLASQNGGLFDMNGTSDYLEGHVIHDHGSNRDIIPGSVYTFFQGFRVGA